MKILMLFGTSQAFDWWKHNSVLKAAPVQVCEGAFAALGGAVYSSDGGVSSVRAAVVKSYEDIMRLRGCKFDLILCDASFEELPPHDRPQPHWVSEMCAMLLKR